MFFLTFTTLASSEYFLILHICHSGKYLICYSHTLLKTPFYIKLKCPEKHGVFT